MNATWLQQQVHTQNLANLETPGYKAKSVVFERELRRSTDRYGGTAATRPALRVRVTEESDSEIRPDGNNVDADAESVELYKAYAHYSMLLDKIKKEVDINNYVLANAPR